MSNLSSQYGQDFESVFVSNSGSISSGKEAKDLNEGEFGFFSSVVSCDADLKSLGLADFSVSNAIQIKMGLPKFSGGDAFSLTRQTNAPRETMILRPNSIVSFEGNRGNGRKNGVASRVSLGYDGIDASKSLSALSDAKRYHVNLILSGPAILRYFGKRTKAIRLSLGKGFCASDCNCVDTCGKVPCTYLADQIVKAVNERVISEGAVGSAGSRFISSKLSNFVKATKITKCTTTVVTPIVTTEYKKYTVTTCGNDKVVLDGLGTQYPGMNISIEKVEDGNTTYAVLLKATDPIPAALKLTSYMVPLCDTCTTCDGTFTKVPASKTVQVRVSCGAPAPVIPGAILTTKVSSSVIAGDVYVIDVATTTTDVAIKAVFVGCLEGAIIGTKKAICKAAEISLPWTSCESLYKASKKYMIVLPDAECGVSNHLPALQAAYVGSTISAYTPAITGTCMSAYQIEVFSEYKSNAADACLPADNNYLYKTPAPYGTFQWQEYATIATDPVCTTPVPAVAPCCSCGVVFEGAVFNQRTEECKTEGWNTWDATDFKPITVKVNIYTEDDYSANPCDESDTQVTVLSTAKMPTGAHGLHVRDLEKEFMKYENRSWSPNPYENETSGGNYIAKGSLIYDHYRLVVSNSFWTSDTYIAPNQSHLAYNFYFPVGMGTQFEKHINKLIASSSNHSLKAVQL